MRLTPPCWLIALAAGIAGCAGGTPDGKPAPFSTEQVLEKAVLTGPEGVTVRLVQTEDAALVQLERVRESLDGSVLLTELEGSTAERYYATQINGRGSRLLGRKDRSWTLFIGGPIALEKDEAASEALDAGALIDAHVHQRADGKLAALARFDADGARTYAEGKLAENMARLEKACGFVPETSIDFSGIEQEELMRYSVPSYCDAPRSPLERACQIPELKPFAQKVGSRIVCKFGPELKLEVEDDALVFTTAFGAANQDDWARKAFDQLELSEGRTVETARIQDKTLVCAGPDGKHHLVVGPTDSETYAGVSYGEGQTLYRQPDRRYLGGGWFFEPRYPNPKHNDNFRGYDLRVFSYVETEDDEQCKLHCGERTVALTPVTGAEKVSFLDAASWKPLPDPRYPHALARDKRGIYYYVDKGATPETAKDFRLYIGPQGRLRLQKMKDIVADSEGEIFASVKGKLKLYLGKDDAEWLSHGRSQKLTRVSIDQNLPLIYNQLGVYLGEPLYTPCDDF